MDDFHFLMFLMRNKLLIMIGLCLISGLNMVETSSQKHLKIAIKEKRVTKVTLLFSVVPPGIEPGTQGFSVLCSTN